MLSWENKNQSCISYHVVIIIAINKVGSFVGYRTISEQHAEVNIKIKIGQCPLLKQNYIIYLRKCKCESYEN